MEMRGMHLVGGEWMGGDPGKPFQASNPATGEEIGPVYDCAGCEMVDLALDRAQEAFLSLRNLKPWHRAEFLECLARRLEGHSRELVSRAQEESGLAVPRLEMEFARMVDQPRRFAALLREGSWVDARIDLGDPHRQPRPKPSMRTMLKPIGPVAVFGASNFPLAISVTGTDTVSALAAGCPVIVKAHPAQPGTCELLAAIVLDTILAQGMDPGIFSVLHGNSNEVGECVVQHPSLAALAFTGSLPGGRSLMDLAASRPVPIPVFAEMGSLNPVFLLPGALAERPEAIARGLVHSLTLDAGQFCTNPGIILAEEGSALERFLEILVPLVSGSPYQVMLHQGIYQNYQRRLHETRATHGVEILASPEAGIGAGPPKAGTFLFRTDYRTWQGQSSLHEECFGPSTILVVTKSKVEMESFAKGMDGSLTATLHGTQKDLDDTLDLQGILGAKAGRIVFNGFPTGVEIGHATHHGGPYPASSLPSYTSIGLAAIRRFVRPVCYQDCPQGQLPPELQDSNPLEIRRVVDGVSTTGPVPP